MKKLILIALAFAAGLLVPYLVAAFVYWDVNPGAWTSDGRFFVSFFSIFAAIVAARIAREMESKEE